MTRLARCLFLGLVAVASLASAQSLDLRTGQWEFTMLMGGSMGDLSNLSPEIRAQIEARLKQPTSYQTCLTAEDLENLNLGEDEDETCKVTSRKVTTKTVDITRTCGDNGERTETMHVETASSESVTARVDTVSSRGPLSMTITGKWIGATCEDEDE